MPPNNSYHLEGNDLDLETDLISRDKKSTIQKEDAFSEEEEACEEKKFLPGYGLMAGICFGCNNFLVG